MKKKEREVSAQSPGLDWTGLQPASGYDLRVYARNGLGNSDPSVYTTMKTLEAGRLSHEGRSGGVGGSQELTWPLLQ